MGLGPTPYNKRNPALRAEHAAVVFDLKIQGLSLREIDDLSRKPDGPTGGHRVSVTTAKEMIREEAARRVDPKVDEYRAIELARLEAALERLKGLEDAAREVLAREHITVNNGRIIVHDGAPLPDDSPVLAAIDRLIKVEDARQRNSESRRRLLGLDMPVKVDAQVTETTQQDLELQEMIRDARARVQLEEQQIVDGGAE
ncbi:hypothetical protein SMD44_00933 [Streptomyces alboflavus]|uniref:Uncharacterized protein n=1 Tax=Streptomyces alboflavus TaxID=67267 RepID=A0A1Z1W537_9ACTN|nr:hypothetical protein [Streptomyces alboflavus]ARX81535.1 hypothetical protein SMD44_00933 [Streptomyces alboflavus]